MLLEEDQGQLFAAWPPLGTWAFVCLEPLCFLSPILTPLHTKTDCVYRMLAAASFVFAVRHLCHASSLLQASVTPTSSAWCSR